MTRERKRRKLSPSRFLAEETLGKIDLENGDRLEVRICAAEVSLLFTHRTVVTRIPLGIFGAVQLRDLLIYTLAFAHKEL